MSDDEREEAVQRIANAPHRDDCAEDECDGGDMGDYDRQAAVVLDAIRQDIATATGYRMRDGKAWAQCITGAERQASRKVEAAPTDRAFKRIPAEVRAELIHMAECRIKDVWADCPEGVDAATLASNVVAAQEFVWMQLAAGVDLRTPQPVQVEVTDEMVERAAEAIFDLPGEQVGDYRWSEMVADDSSRADIWRADARAVLTAALTPPVTESEEI